jgi:hypothetical protein
MRFRLYCSIESSEETSRVLHRIILIGQLFFLFFISASTKLKVKMISDNLNTQTHFEKEHHHQLEQIIVGIAKINTGIDEIREKLDCFDKRHIVVEQRQDQMKDTTPRASAANSALIENNNRFFQPEKTKKEEEKRSTCACCAMYTNEKCSFYFDDLYNFNTKQINTELGADPIRFECPCTHLIRHHDRDPSNYFKINLLLKIYFIHLDSLATELPDFANPPLRQRLYEDWLPPLIQDWFPRK